MIIGKLHSDKIVSSSADAFSLFDRSSLGEKKNNKIEYSLIEALFLLSQNKMTVFLNSKKIDEEVLLKKIKRLDKRIETKFTVFSDLRKKGYIVKSALKFGADFRVYDKGIKPSFDHAKWILYVVKEHETLNWHDFAAKNRVAHSTNKNLLIAIVDEENDVSYYEVSWKRT